MFTSFFSTIFATQKSAHWTADLITALPRIVCGYLLCTSFGWSKCPAPEWFVSDVAALGFPAPVFFAWAAVLSEVVGGAMLVLGLGTRLAAASLVCTMLSAIFLQKWGGEVWEMLPAMGFLWVALYALVHGSGRFGFDYFITTRLTKNATDLGKNKVENTAESTIKNNSNKPVLATIFLFSLLCANTNTAFAQSRPLRGSGNIITKTYDFKDFDKVELADLDGKTTIEIGKTFAIKIEIDDNLLPILKVENRNGKLLVAFDKNENNRRYIEDTGLRINITMPEISVLEHHGNSGVVVNGIVGRYFSIENDGNGGATLNGTIDKLDIKQRGNGSVQAKNLTAKFVNVNAAGNGSVKVNASVSLSAKGKGNGSIINTGNGKIEPLSGVIGNGEVRSE
jgi:uncharacterized membrane protein YphA (DoxX/SURF4 family)